tara:strand:+ start:254 stop:3004 length:2751 start_codon:yes stop_codon:yes gene_type:complete
MTSSFGTVIGTPRDKLPDISSTNYDRVTPDLSETINKQIDNNIADTKNFFAEMMKIAQLRYDNRDNNLKALAEFSTKAGEFARVLDTGLQVKEVYQKRRKQIDGIREGINEKNNLDVAEKEKEEFTDGAAAELVQENTVESTDVAFVITKKDEEEATIQGKYSLDNLNFGVINETMLKNDAYNMTSLEAGNLYDKTLENFGIAVFMDAEKNGINTKGGKWERYYIEKVIPKLEQDKEKWMLGHETYKKQIVVNGLNDKKKTKISEYLNAEVPDTEGLINYVIKTNGGAASGFTRTDAILDIASTIYNSLRNRDGRFSRQDAEKFKNDLQFLDSSKSKPNKPVYTSLAESNFGPKGSVTTTALSMLERGIDFATDDPKAIEKAKINRFITDVLPQFAEEDGSYTDASKLAIQDAWIKEIGINVPFDQSILSLEAQSSTGNRYGSNYGAYSVPGQADPFREVYEQLEGDLLSQVNDLKSRGARYTKLPPSRRDELTLAYADFKNLMNLSESGNQGLDFRQRIQENLKTVSDKLLNGKYANKIVPPDFNTGQPEDVEADANYFLQDKSRINSAEFASAIEKNNLEISRAAIERGDIAGAYTPYWRNVSKKMGDPGPDFLLKRLQATGGMKDGYVVDKGIYDLDREDLYELNRNPNAHTSINIFNKVNSKGKKNSEIMLNSLRVKDRNGDFVADGHYIIETAGARSDIIRDNGDKLTLQQLINMRATDVGRYKIPNSVLKELLTYGPPGNPIIGDLLNKEFDENSQSIVAFLAWHMQLEKMNGIRGVGLNEKQVKTLFPHSDLTVEERELVDTFMPNLKDLPYFSKPHTIMQDVMNVVMGPNEAAQNKVFEEKIPFDKLQEFTASKGLGTDILHYNQLNVKHQKELIKFLKLKKKKTDFGFDLVDIDYKEPKVYKKRTRR